MEHIDFIGEQRDMKKFFNIQGQNNRGPFSSPLVNCLAIIVTLVTFLGCVTSRNPFVQKENRTKIANPIIKAANTSHNVISYDNDPLLTLLREATVNENGEVTCGVHSLPKAGSKLVNNWIKYFQTNGRQSYEKWLARSRSYVAVMKGILRSEGLPPELVYLAMIESGFNPQAYSPAAAAGQWQFIKGTGKAYGLEVNKWIDDRRDPIKSTIAAARHLKDLFDEFESWKLAAAGYNAGSGKIRNAIRRYKSEDFWYISNYNYLMPETKNYVPKMIAAAILAREPERYGFTNIKYERPYEFEEVVVHKQTSLEAIAKAAGADLARVKVLNPHILRGVTPPNFNTYIVRIPKGTETQFANNFKQQPKVVEVADLKPVTQISAPTVTLVQHKVMRGQTLQGIAKSYGVSVSSLMRRNQLRSPRDIKAGQILAIPSIASKKLVATASNLDDSNSSQKSPSQKARKNKKVTNRSRKKQKVDVALSAESQHGTIIPAVSQNETSAQEDSTRTPSVNQKSQFVALFDEKVGTKSETASGTEQTEKNTQAE